MNILIIGNGFDLAHGLPTRYMDFLKFVKATRQIIEKGKQADLSNIFEKNRDFSIKKLIEGNTEKIFQQKETWKGLLDNNIWIDYFLQRKMDGSDNWIDFESEISKVIKNIDENMGKKDFNSFISELSNRDVDIYFFVVQAERKSICNITYRELRNKLLNSLCRLIRALEIYLCDFVEKIDCKEELPDIKGIVDKTTTMKPCKVLNFNYTSTYEKIYLNKIKAEEKNEACIDYIHGKADSERNCVNNNMVLGIDEYLPDDRKDKDVEFIAFKKFYQRIYKGTGCKYKEWINEIRHNYEMYEKAEQNCLEMMKHSMTKGDKKEALRWLDAQGENHNKKMEKFNVYIFGHSLDVTDKDIFRDFILNDNVYTTIYYHKKDDLAQKITNLVKIIGQDELIRRTGGSAKTIEFKLQQKTNQQK